MLEVIAVSHLQFINAPLAVRPLVGAGWVAMFGALLVVASPDADHSWISAAAGAGFQLLATLIFAALAALWRPSFVLWWRIAAAASVVPAVVLAICVVLMFTPTWLQLTAQGVAAAQVLLYTYHGHRWRGALVAAGAMMLMRGMMISILYLTYLLFVVLQI